MARASARIQYCSANRSTILYSSRGVAEFNLYLYGELYCLPLTVTVLIQALRLSAGSIYFKIESQSIRLGLPLGLAGTNMLPSAVLKILLTGINCRMASGLLYRNVCGRSVSN